jgi:hypothetical protein
LESELPDRLKHFALAAAQGEHAVPHLVIGIGFDFDMFVLFVVVPVC